ncbi:CGNR zinc finger domain-containing protein [Epibacterium ulvae]|uniref:CGNR zinc finger domain-containing protein n=1 Tax=Epibacterium ulvae TaxID=1156985 RepID=UPI001BFCD15C|nr:CGNR zinc finger domain-containing protein [Epibacterium ulvae]MBT8154021.1 CGNR zinc finger domain-containing protein [Epibacterium ulvae]
MASNLPAPYLIADHVGLEVVNTIGAPYGAELDWLVNGQELLSWMAAVGLLTAKEAARLAAALTADDLEKAADTLRALRTEMQENIPEASPEFMARLNDLLTTGRGHYEIETGAEGQRNMRFQPLLETADDLVVRVAVEIAELYCLNTPERMRECGSPTCTYWFHDNTRNNRRRWCSMAVCGNRAKVKAHRARQ